MKPRKCMTKTDLKKRQESPDYLNEVEVAEMEAMGTIEIVERGEENLYFTKDNKKYFCKCL